MNCIYIQAYFRLWCLLMFNRLVSREIQCRRKEEVGSDVPDWHLFVDRDPDGETYKGLKKPARDGLISGCDIGVGGLDSSISETTAGAVQIWDTLPLGQTKATLLHFD